MKQASASVVCDRVRSQLSLQLDAEPSELERRMIAAHLSSCPDCSAFEREVVGLAGVLRSAPLEQMEHHVVVRVPARTSVIRRPIGIAAVLAIAAVGLYGSTLQLEQRPSGGGLRYESKQQLEREVELLKQAPPPERPGQQGTLQAI